MSEQEVEKQDLKERRVEFKFPLLTVRTNAFSGVFDRLGSLRGVRVISLISILLVPFVAAIGIYLILGSLIALLSNPAVGGVTRELGPGALLLLPGVNPILPIAYGWVAIVCAVAVHEGAHGIIARSEGLRVKSSGLLFFLIIPIGAFVDVDEDQLKKAKHTSSFRVMAAGVAGNAAVAAACLVGVLLIVGSLTPVIDGVYIGNVTAGMPAQAAGLLPKDVLVSIDGVRVNDTKILKDLLGNKTGGDIVSVTVARGENWQDRFTANVTLVSTENGTMMGVSVGNLATRERLSSYKAITWQKLAMYLVPPTLASGLVPFSDSLSPFYSSALGSEWPILANVLFWLWFVNFNVAMFNALPIYPLDGGRMFNIGLKATLGRKLSERGISITTFLVSAVCLAIVVLIAVLPFIR